MKERIAATIVESGAFADMTKTIQTTIQGVVDYVKTNPRIFSDLFETGVATGRVFLDVTSKLLPFFKYLVENRTALMAVLGAYAGAFSLAACLPGCSAVIAANLVL